MLASRGQRACASAEVLPLSHADDDSRPLCDGLTTRAFGLDRDAT